MYLLKNAAMKVGDVFWFGNLQGMEFYREYHLNEMGEENISCTLKDFFKMRGINGKYLERMKEVYEASEIWLMKPKGEGQDRKNWRKRNKKCLSCTNKCKQSIMANIYYCKRFKEKKK